MAVKRVKNGDFLVKKGEKPGKNGENWGENWHKR